MCLLVRETPEVSRGSLSESSKVDLPNHTQILFALAAPSSSVRSGREMETSADN